MPIRVQGSCSLSVIAYMTPLDRLEMTCKFSVVNLNKAGFELGSGPAENLFCNLNLSLTF